MNFENLKEHILPLSQADDFGQAKQEWDLDSILITEDFGHCPCGHPIKEHCYLKNKKNGNETWVGNVCVKKFLDINAGNLFNGLKRIQKNNLAKPNIELSEYAWKHGHLYGENEYLFLKNIRRKKILSKKQEPWLQKINRRIVKNIVVRCLPAPIPNSNGDDGNKDIVIISNHFFC